MDEIRRVAGDYIAGMTPTVIVPAMLSFQVRRPIGSRGRCSLIGVDEETHAQVSDFGRFLQHPANRKQLSFDLREERLRRASTIRPAPKAAAPANGYRRLGASPHGKRSPPHGCI